MSALDDVVSFRFPLSIQAQGPNGHNGPQLEEQNNMMEWKENPGQVIRDCLKLLFLNSKSQKYF